MDPAHPREVTGSPEVIEIVEVEPPPSMARPLVSFKGVSKWYGNVIGVNKLTLDLPPGVTGLLGPNGAGKSTLLQLATGQLQPSQGEVRVLGQRPWNNPAVCRLLGLCPEQDAFYEWMTGFEFVFTCARLSGLERGEARDAAEHAMAQVRLTDAMHRVVRGYSKGMRQRTKLAQALVHEPEVLFLDEPLTGTDPVARRELIDIILTLAGQGKSVLVSSHVLYEVQALTTYIVLMNRGRLVAVGHVRHIRDLIDKHPHRIVLVCENPRELASRLVKWEGVSGVQLDLAERRVTVETLSPDRFYGDLPNLAVQSNTAIEELYSDDDNLEAVFQYLVMK